MVAHYVNLKLDSPLYRAMRERWQEGLREAFRHLPKFDWEAGTP